MQLKRTIPASLYASQHWWPICFFKHTQCKSSHVLMTVTSPTGPSPYCLPTNTSVVFCEWFSVCLFVFVVVVSFGGATFFPFPHFNSNSIVICAPFSVFLFGGVFLSCSVFDLFGVTVLNSQPQESQLAETVTISAFKQLFYCSN